MKKTNSAKKEKLGLTKKTIVKLSNGVLNFGANANTATSTEGDTGSALIDFLTQ